MTTNLASGTTTVTATGASQVYTAAGAGVLVAKLWGAGGGGCSYSGAVTGGAVGGYTTVTFSVNKGDTIRLDVGGGGLPGRGASVSGGAGGWPDGGYGGMNASAGGGGGGGSTRIWLNGTILGVAGAGGGAGTGITGSSDSRPAAQGGGASGGSAVCTVNGKTAGGGTQTAGGVNSDHAYSNGGYLTGGLGYPSGGSPTTSSNASGGGGGGGYYGGAGGGDVAVGMFGGGGGGSGYSAPSNTAGTTTESSSFSSVPNTSDPNYVAGVGAGGASTTSGVASTGGNGLGVMNFTPNNLPLGKTSVAYSAGTTNYNCPYAGTVLLKLWGAGGGGSVDNSNAVYANGANGGFSTVSVTVAAGDTIAVQVGGGGLPTNPNHSTTNTAGAGGYPDGGAGGSDGYYDTGAGGGGSTRVYQNGTLVAVAGAGGGGVGTSGSVLAYGFGGGATGGTGGGASDPYGSAPGGSQTAGGVQSKASASNGASLKGGAGNNSGQGGAAGTNTNSGGGGGGGGYYGGAGGYGVGGGGGSSYTTASGTGASTTSGTTSAAGGSTDSDYTSGIGLGAPGVLGVNATPTSGANGAAVLNYTIPLTAGTATQSTYTGSRSVYTATQKGMLTAKLWGGGGGGGISNSSAPTTGGAGYSFVTFPVNANDTIWVDVAGGGQPGTSVATGSSADAGGAGGWPDGGGASYSSSNAARCGGGGGSTRVFLNGTLMAIAGGSGGAGNTAAGGFGGGPTAGGGYGATGGTQTTGGSTTNSNTATTGASLQGANAYGTGNSTTTNQSSLNGVGGGGGGGYFGGGAGYSIGGGAGGSNWVSDASYQVAGTAGSAAGTPGNSADSSYVSGVGVGGASGASAKAAAGGNGLAVLNLTAAPTATTLPTVKTSVAYSGFSSTYTAPSAGVLSLKLWGAGGGGGLTSGGVPVNAGAGFTTLKLALATNDVVRVDVGGGGGQSCLIANGDPLDAGGYAGWPDGGGASNGNANASTAGGGGGSTRVFLNGVLMAVAAGAGGTGNTTGGGFGGGSSGGAGYGSTGGSQTAAGTTTNTNGNDAASLKGGDGYTSSQSRRVAQASTNGAGGGGGGGYYGGGAGYSIGAGAGGSGYTSTSALVSAASTTAGTAGSKLPANSTDTDYASGVGTGGTSVISGTPTTGGNGLAVMNFAAGTPAAASGSVGTVTMTTPAGSAVGHKTAAASGTVGTVTMTTPAGSAVGHKSASTSGAVGTVSMVKPAGSASALAHVTGSVGTVTLTAPHDTVSAGAHVSKGFGAVTASAPAASAVGAKSASTSGLIGTVTMTTPAGSAVGHKSASTGGAVGTVTMSAPAARVSFPAHVTGTVGTVTLTAPQDAAHAGASVSRSIGAVTATPPTATAFGAKSASTSGLLGTVALTTPAGKATVPIAVSGAVGAVTLVKPAATAVGHKAASTSGSVGTVTASTPAATGFGGKKANTSGLLGTITTLRPAGTAQGYSSATGALKTLAVTAPAARAGVSIHVSGALPTIQLTTTHGLGSGAAKSVGVLGTVTIVGDIGGLGNVSADIITDFNANNEGVITVSPPSVTVHTAGNYISTQVNDPGLRVRMGTPLGGVISAGNAHADLLKNANIALPLLIKATAQSGSFGQGLIGTLTVTSIVHGSANGTAAVHKSLPIVSIEDVFGSVYSEPGPVIRPLPAALVLSTPHGTAQQGVSAFAPISPPQVTLYSYPQATGHGSAFIDAAQRNDLNDTLVGRTPLRVYPPAAYGTGQAATGAYAFTPITFKVPIPITQLSARVLVTLKTIRVGLIAGAAGHNFFTVGAETPDVDVTAPSGFAGVIADVQGALPPVAARVYAPSASATGAAYSSPTLPVVAMQAPVGMGHEGAVIEPLPVISVIAPVGVVTGSAISTTTFPMLADPGLIAPNADAYGAVMLTPQGGALSIYPVHGAAAQGFFIVGEELFPLHVQPVQAVATGSAQVFGAVIEAESVAVELIAPLALGMAGFSALAMSAANDNGLIASVSAPQASALATSTQGAFGDISTLMVSPPMVSAVGMRPPALLQIIKALRLIGQNGSTAARAALLLGLDASGESNMEAYLVQHALMQPTWQFYNDRRYQLTDQGYLLLAVAGINMPQPLWKIMRRVPTGAFADNPTRAMQALAALVADGWVIFVQSAPSAPPPEEVHVAPLWNEGPVRGPLFDQDAPSPGGLFALSPQLLAA